MTWLDEIEERLNTLSFSLLGNEAVKLDERHRMARVIRELVEFASISSKKLPDDVWSRAYNNLSPDAKELLE